MEEHFEIGDLVAFTIKGIVYYGTIVSKSDRCANLDTYKLAIPLQELTHASGFRVGSIVQIKKDLRHGIQYGTLKFYNSDLCGTITTVTKVSRNGTYYLEGISGQTFSKEMLEFPIKPEDLVTLKPSAYPKFPSLAGTIYKVEEILKDGSRCNIGGAGVSPLDLEKIAESKEELFKTLYTPSTFKYVGNNKLEISHGDQKEIFDLNVLENENQLQRKDSAVIRGERPEGSRIYGRRPKATISVRPLSHKTCTGFSQGQG